MTGMHGFFFGATMWLAKMSPWRTFGLGPRDPFPSSLWFFFLDRLGYPHLALSWKLCNRKHCNYIRGDVIMTQQHNTIFNACDISHGQRSRYHGSA